MIWAAPQESAGRKRVCPVLSGRHEGSGDVVPRLQQSGSLWKQRVNRDSGPATASPASTAWIALSLAKPARPLPLVPRKNFG